MDRNKVVEINLELGNPSVEDALKNMANSLLTYKRQGVKAAILIHGYGSSGVGGSIKAAIRKKLSDNSMRGIVRTYAEGEEWQFKKRTMVAMCKSLELFDRRIAYNEGITVVIFQ